MAVGEAGFFLIEDSLGVALDEAAAVGVRFDVEEACLEVAEEALAYAKMNAPWDDRTGDAREGLDVEVESDDESVSIQLYHTVDYGLWLEVIQSGRFAIIMPTLENFAAPRLEARIRGGDVTVSGP